jgi:hypothetical protein
LAADRCHGTGRAPLVEMLWRVKMPQAHDVLIEAINDPTGSDARCPRCGGGSATSPRGR